MFAIDRDKIGDDLLLIRNAHCKVLNEALEQRGSTQSREELITGYFFQRTVLHRGGCFQPPAQPGQAELAEHIPGPVNGKHAFPSFSREHYKFDLPGLYKVYGLPWIPN